MSFSRLAAIGLTSVVGEKRTPASTWKTMPRTERRRTNVNSHRQHAPLHQGLRIARAMDATNDTGTIRLLISISNRQSMG
jgi:hypothetical protein